MLVNPCRKRLGCRQLLVVGQKVGSQGFCFRVQGLGQTQTPSSWGGTPTAPPLNRQSLATFLYPTD
jgi:hypothetical protein